MSGLALRGAFDCQGAGDGKIFALVIERVLLVWVEEHTRLAIALERVVFIRTPKAAYDIKIFNRAAVARIVIIMFVQAELPAAPAIAARHHIPARTAAADEIEGGKAPGEIERGVERRRRRADEADIARRDGQSRQKREGLEAIEVVWRRVFGDVLAVHQRDEIKLGGFRLAHNIDVPNQY